VDVLQIAALVTYAFGAFSYGTILAMSLRPSERTQVPAPSGLPQRSLLVGLMLWTVTCVWFVVNLLIELQRLGSAGPVWPMEMAGLWLACAFPPLIVHITWAEVVDTRPTAPGRAWSLAVWPMYALAAALAIVSTLGFMGVTGRSVDDVARRASIGLTVLFIAASVYASALLARHDEPARTPRERQSSRWHIALFALMGLLFLVLLRLATHEEPVARVLGRALELLIRSLPIAFMFAGTYFEYRFEFFDLFIKRGLSLLVTIGVLTAWFALVLPWLAAYDSSWAAPWVHAVALLPIALALPWLHGQMHAVLDRRWLGRRFATVAAVKHFLATLRTATDESQVVAQAEAGLREIFDAPAAVVLDERPDVPDRFSVVARADIRLSGRTVGGIRMGQRRSEAPYFSEDTALLETLADLLASVLHNVRLQRREQEQGRAAQALSLHASQSELKALRAQINPHFLFNALNAIAGLIHRSPDLADRTIEKLADVFRYTLRGSEGEWAVLDDELQFVRAYLDVEEARFGTRLSTAVHLDEDTRGARLPTMIVQTLVENAIKHGASAVRARATVTVRARRDGDRLTVVVEDNGPGLEPGAAECRTPTARGGGFGLASTRQRLAGHFGPSASLVLERDAAQGVTRACITLPFLLEEPRPAAAGTSEGALR
jgi:signal transduction histidine kinase